MGGPRKVVLVMAAALVAAGVVAACSEATDGVLDAGPTGALPEEDGAPGRDATKPDARAPSFLDASNVTRSAILLNELSPSGEWVEIVNAGTEEADLSGYKVADRDKVTGEPKLSDAVELPPGTQLSPAAYGMVLGGGVDAGKPCPTGGQAFCAHAAFGVSKKDGETIFLLGPDGGILGSLVSPPSDAGAKTQTWCRLPNADPAGTFGNCTESPGAPNL